MTHGRVKRKEGSGQWVIWFWKRKLAEEEGFEPSYPGTPGKRFSRPPHSTTLPPLRMGWIGWVFMPTYKKGVTVKVPPG